MPLKRSMLAIVIFMLGMFSQLGSAYGQQLGCLPVRQLAETQRWEVLEAVSDGGIRVRTSVDMLLPVGYEAVGAGDRKILVNSVGNDRWMAAGIWSVYDGKCIGGAQPVVQASQPQVIQPLPQLQAAAVPQSEACLNGWDLAALKGWKVIQRLNFGGAVVELPSPTTVVPAGYVVHKDPGAVIASIYPPETNECRLSLGLPAVRPLDTPAQAQAALVDLTPVGEPEQGLCLTAWDLAARYGWEVVATPDHLTMYGGAVIKLTNGTPIPAGWIFQTDGSGTGTLFPPETQQCRVGILGVRFR